MYAAWQKGGYYAIAYNLGPVVLPLIFGASIFPRMIAWTSLAYAMASDYNYEIEREVITGSKQKSFWKKGMLPNQEKLQSYFTYLGCGIVAFSLLKMRMGKLNNKLRDIVVDEWRKQQKKWYRFINLFVYLLIIWLTIRIAFLYCCLLVKTLVNKYHCYWWIKLILSFIFSSLYSTFGWNSLISQSVPLYKGFFIRSLVNSPPARRQAVLPTPKCSFSYFLLSSHRIHPQNSQSPHFQPTSQADSPLDTESRSIHSEMPNNIVSSKII